MSPSDASIGTALFAQNRSIGLNTAELTVQAYKRHRNEKLMIRYCFLRCLSLSHMYSMRMFRTMPSTEMIWLPKAIC